jgi:hypothetical protein
VSESGDTRSASDGQSLIGKGNATRKRHRDGHRFAQSRATMVDRRDDECLDENWRIGMSPALGLVAGLGMLALQVEPAIAAVTVTLSITPQTSTPMGIVPNQPGQGNGDFYAYSITDGQSISDTIPVQLCITAQESTSWTSFNVQFGPIGAGGNLPGVTLPATVTFNESDVGTALPFCKTTNILISTGALNLPDPNVSKLFNKEINIGVTGETPSSGLGKLKVSSTGESNIHIKVLVKPGSENNVSCFITDSSGNFLTNCAGEPVNASGSDDGRFAIVANKKLIEVATNPGQFYDNVLYVNTGSSPITVDVHFTRDGVDPHGTQAIHALVFAPPFSGITQDNFNDVNDGIPGGQMIRLMASRFRLDGPYGWTTISTGTGWVWPCRRAARPTVPALTSTSRCRRA